MKPVSYGLLTLHGNGSEIGTIGNNGSWSLSLSQTGVNISTWYYTFLLVPVLVPSPCSVNIHFCCYKKWTSSEQTEITTKLIVLKLVLHSNMEKWKTRSSYLVIISSAVAHPIPAIMNFSWPLPAILDMIRCKPTKSAKSTVHFRNSCHQKCKISRSDNQFGGAMSLCVGWISPRVGIWPCIWKLSFASRTKDILKTFSKKEKVLNQQQGWHAPIKTKFRVFSAFPRFFLNRQNIFFSCLQKWISKFPVPWQPWIRWLYDTSKILVSLHSDHLKQLNISVLMVHLTAFSDLEWEVTTLWTESNRRVPAVLIYTYPYNVKSSCRYFRCRKECRQDQHLAQLSK